MLDHVSIGVRDLDRSKAFYDVVLATLGYRQVNDLPDSYGYGPDRDTDEFYIVQRGSDRDVTPGPGFHLAFAAPDRGAVAEFHRVALEQGARDDGAPGLRPRYHANYYAAFVVEPDGHRLEAVCHHPE